MIQKRWVKEAEEKANNVWDAIREIPDLDADLRYEEMTLVHSLGMKSVVTPPPDLILQRTLDISPPLPLGSFLGTQLPLCREH
ncbi:hypothetical protein YC2023_071351 [Brassica napus]